MERKALKLSVCGGFQLIACATFATILCFFYFDSIRLIKSPNYSDSLQLYASAFRSLARLSASQSSLAPAEYYYNRSPQQLIISELNSTADSVEETENSVRISDGRSITEKQTQSNSSANHDDDDDATMIKPDQVANHAQEIVEAAGINVGNQSSCNFFQGRWVRDESYPIYRSQDCPFVDDGFRCQENGRPDEDYLHWRWQPAACNLPRFDAAAMREKLRGKRIVFVGDSIGRNQWESMLCMLANGMSAHEARTRVYEVNGEPITKHTGFLAFRFADYDLTVEYYRSPFLVPHTRAPPHAPANVSSVLRVDLMDWSSKKWLPADVIIFNTGHWWSFEKIIRGGCYFQVGKKVNKTMDIRDGFRAAMRTWRRWVAKEVDLKKTKVFLRTYAPAHFSGGTWKTGGQCHEVTEPWPMDTQFETEPWTNKYVRSEAGHLDVQLLDITHLSNYRRDAHSSIYNVGKDQPREMRRQDCSHWCLPGLPDTWNELVFAALS